MIGDWVRLAREQNAAGLFDAFAQALYPAAFYDTIRPMLPVVAAEATAEDLERFCAEYGVEKSAIRTIY